MEYDVISENDLSALIEEVNKALSLSWKLQGGIYVLYREWKVERKGYTESETTYYQAIYREKST